MMNHTKRAELLAPAGSFDIAKAVINAGADAVYLGGRSFGARAYAGNLSEEEVIQIIDYAHLRGSRIYMTMNTLVKPTEMNDSVVEYLKPYYEAGLDAVLVQDLGMFRLVKQAFPELPIHVSTQMTTTGPESARLLVEEGAERIVLSRELNLSELSQVKQAIGDREIEVFVHGALCYCYSGQCLMSSFRGGRSGNRGRCAQPCRQEYTAKVFSNLTDVASVVNDRKHAYMLSPKDICTIEILPDIIEAGAYSLKIEGRMKNVTYAAGVTSIYRKYLDMYLENGREGYKVDEKDVADLQDLYNRGGFTTGYFNHDKGADMMSVKRPNHAGTNALKVVSNRKGAIDFVALEDITKQDVFEIDADHSFMSGEEVKTGGHLYMNLPKEYRLIPGNVVRRMNKGDLKRFVEAAFVHEERKVPVNLKFVASVGKKAVLTMEVGGVGVQAESEAEIEAAGKLPAEEKQVADRLKKLGDTPFVAKKVEVKLFGDLFVPNGVLNNMRREAAALLEDAIVTKYRRTMGEDVHVTKHFNSLKNDGKIDKVMPVVTSAFAMTREQALAANVNEVQEIYLHYTIADRELAEEFKNAGKAVYVALPEIVRGKNLAKFKRSLDEYLEAVKCGVIDGFLVRNLEELTALEGTHAKVVIDSSLYTANVGAVTEVFELCEKLEVEPVRLSVNVELTEDELSLEMSETEGVQWEIPVYGRTVLMQSEQCVRRTTGHCNHRDEFASLTDKSGKVYVIRSLCDYCYTLMFDEKPLDIREDVKQSKLRFACVRYTFTTETKEEVKRILAGGITDSTKGHFISGIL